MTTKKTKKKIATRKLPVEKTLTAIEKLTVGDKTKGGFIEQASPEACINCKFFHKAGLNMVCRKGPPTLVVGYGEFHSLHPDTLQSEWCGAFEMKPELKARREQ